MTPTEIALASLGAIACIVAIYAAWRWRQTSENLYEVGQARYASWRKIEALERELAAQASKRSETTRRGNVTRAAKRRAEQAPTTARLESGT